MIPEQYWGRLVDDFVSRFNEHRTQAFRPSELICENESMSRWYEAGGYCINHGLPQYMEIDRTPENGCEIQNAACGSSGIMMRLKLLKNSENEILHLEKNGDERLAHGTRVLKELVILSLWQGLEGLLWQTLILNQWRPPRSCIVLD